MSKDIVGLLTLQDRDGNVVHQGGNVSFLYQARYRTIYRWNNNYGGSYAGIVALPWKMAFLLRDDDINIGHDIFHRAAGAIYPADPTGGVVTLNSLQYNFFRATGTIGTVPAANIPRVFGGVGAVSQYPGTRISQFGGGDSIISQVDVPLDYTQIGIVYMHPAHQQLHTVATTAGLSYLTYTNAQFWDSYAIVPGALGIVRIETGSDAGFYFVTNNDFTNNRLYLRCLDGTPFRAVATASNLTATAAPGRRAWFNEVSVIPLSVGTVEAGGRYNPRNAAAPYLGDSALRESFILRLTLEKTGSTEAASGTEQQGSYLMSLRPFTHGEGSLASVIPDSRAFADDYFLSSNGGEFPPWLVNLSGGTNGLALDYANQRLWFCTTTSSNQSSLFHWRWKTTEGIREVANYLGTAPSASFLSPTPVLGAGDVITDIEIGSNAGSAQNWVYVTVYHASGGNAGVIVIKPDLTTLQYGVGAGVPASVLAGSAVDRSRARTGTAADVSTNASNTVTSASGGFTNADIGRAIKLTGLGADSGTYKISSIGGATTVGVQTLAGGVVTFTTQSGGTFEIGDRLYLFFNDGANGAGKINYMESMAPGTFLTRTVTMTNGATVNTRVTGGTGLVYGQRVMCSVDAANGNVYWLSNDTQQQINKYDVSANTHAFIAIGDTALLAPPGGVVVGGASPATNPASPTMFSAIHVNSKFDDIWVGSDAGHFRIAKSTFAASSTRRYYGTETTSYMYGAPLTTGTGDGVTGLSFSTPNVTITATGTPFVASDVGKYIVITGASSVGNNGVFPITAFNSSSSVTFTNASGATQANYAGTFHVVRSYSPYSDGCYQSSGSTSRFVRWYLEGVDGRMYTLMRNNNTAAQSVNYFSQEASNWFYRGDLNANNGAECNAVLADRWGRFFNVCMGATSGASRWTLHPYEIEYQWDNSNSKWFPKEWVKTSVPNKSVSDTTSPNALARPIHSTLEDVMFGVKVRWNRQGGATPANNEFLGRGGQSRTTATDGSTTAGGNTFGGSSFTAGDVGKLLRIESGSDAGVYKVSAFINAASVTLQRMDGQTLAFLATAATLTYTVWDLGTPGANAGPENVTVLLADGFSKDNTQDITGMTYETFGFKTRFSENVEDRKFTVESPLAVPGATETKVYYETYARAIPQYDAALSHHRALPAAEATNGRQLADFMQDKFLQGTGGRANLHSSPADAAIWYGRNANSSVLGCSPMVDLGKDVEVGYVQLRFHSFVGLGYNQQGTTATANGLLANLYSASNAGGSPVASLISSGTGDTIGGAAPNMTLTDAGAAFTASDVGRYITITGATTPANNGTFVIASFTSSTLIGYTNASGVAEAFSGLWFITNQQPRTGAASTLNVSGADVTTVTLSSGDFLGAVTTGPFANGAITAGGNTFVAPAATFVAGDRMKILSITAGAGADNGAYRIITVSGDGSTVTVRNLDQTAKAWGSSASGLTYAVQDGVQEEDQILTTTGTQHRLAVERLLTSTSLQVRTGPNATVSNQSWICVKPSWAHVKRLSFSTEAVQPEVKNNGTWLSSNGRNNYDLNDVVVYFDLTDLPTAQRTGRFWKWTGIPRFNGSSGYDTTFNWTGFELYDPTGAKLATSKYLQTDQCRTNADFYFSYLNRVDFVQAASDAMSGVAGFNGNVDLGGASGDTLTLTTGGNKFLGFQVRVPYTDGTTTSPNAFNSASAVWTTADVGRFVRFTTGTYSGNYYRIASRVSATQVTLVTPSGGAPGLATDAGPMNFTVHTGINAGGSLPDRFAVRRLGTAGDVTTTVGTNQFNSASGAFTQADLGKLIKVSGATADNGQYVIKTVPSSTQVTVVSLLGAVVSFAGGTGGTFEVDSDLREYSIATINDALTTITISETLQPAVTGRKWEIRRPGYDTTSTTTEPTKSARITRPQSTYPVQSGDICQDSRGHYRFFAEDIGAGYQRADGSITGGSGVFTGTSFCSDDVGRLLYIDTGANKGIYEISVFTSATSITVKNHYTGAAVSFTADAGPVTYRIFGDCRFRLAKYCTGLRA